MWTRPASSCLWSSTVLLLASISRATAAEPPIGLEAASLQQACGLAEAAGVDQDHQLAVVLPLPIDGGGPPPVPACPGRPVVFTVRLEPPTAWQHGADPYAGVKGWLEELEALLQARPEYARSVQLGRRPDQAFEPNAFAFLVEKVSTLMRSIDPQASLVLGPLADGAEEWFERLDAGRVAPYVRGVSLESPADAAAWAGRFARRFPGLPIWLHAPAPGGPAEWMRTADAARRAGIASVFAPGDDPGTSAAVAGLVKAVPSRFVVDPEPPAPSGQPHAGSLETVARLVDPLGPEKAAVLAGPLPGAAAIGRGPLRQVRASELSTGAWVPVEVQAGQGASEVRVGRSDGLVLLRFVAVQGPRGETETVGVTEDRELTAEEVLAGLRAFEAAQERELRHYTATATISYHYRAESLNEAIDVTSVNRFFWKDRVGEYEETSLYVNGARWRGPSPSLPFIAAEKVKEVPLEIRLDQSYLYRLKGKDSIGGRPAYALEFEPIEPGSSLYSGTIWVHRESFARLRLRLVQHGLKEPVTSNVDEIQYAPVESPGLARPVWLPVRGDRQMVFTVLGRAVAVERRVDYGDFSINQDGFETHRDQAYASGKPILRDSSAGYAYLVRGKDGSLTAQKESLQNVAFFGGMAASTDGGLGSPFAGMNYFDFDWRGTGTQVDVAFAGVLLDVAWTDPSLADTPWELTVEGRATAFPDSFKKVTEQGRDRSQDVEVLEQRLFTTLGYPLSSFSKAEFLLEGGFDNFGASEDTSASFVLPATRPVATGTARWRHHRKGIASEIWYSAGRRFGWRDWGDPAAGEGSFGTQDEAGFQRWGVGLLKAFYPARFHKISLGASAQAGRDLDRFSRFRVGDFRNVRVRGYNSFDITFDRGVTAQASYLFTLPRGGAALDLSLEAAVVENDEDFEGRESVAGGGIALSLSGPWGTLLSFRSGFPLGSSLDLDSGGTSVRMVIIKTYDRWPFGQGARDR
ncbi:MAG TPA: hypothetical protein VJV23_01825 [Candidatus Polarisedimenticolia bacterium]|nr:hypothetical protein [Candidatus Polarisedimenticolia bacterium]